MSEQNSPVQTTYRFYGRLTMLSDWHVGSGMGRPGHIDRLIVRDKEGFPYVPAKTLKGIWRDACERLAWGLDGGKEGLWLEWVKYLFGDQPARRGETDPTQAPRKSVLLMASARLPESLRRVFCARKEFLREFQQALCFVKPGVAIDPKTGRAKDECLRFEEMARAGTVLTTEVQMRLPKGVDSHQQTAALSLLMASTRLVERLGGKRRRGAGKCQWELQLREPPQNAWTPQQAIDWLQHCSAPPPVPRGDDAGSEAFPSARLRPADSSADWIDIPYVVDLISPVNIGGTHRWQLRGNSGFYSRDLAVAACYSSF